MQNYYGSLCLSDIPKEFIKDINGKKYLNINVVELKQLSQYGDSHFISVSLKKEEREKLGEGVKTIIGNLKPSMPSVPTVEDIANAQPMKAEDNDLPF